MDKRKSLADYKDYLTYLGKKEDDGLPLSEDVVYEDSNLEPIKEVGKDTVLAPPEPLEDNFISEMVRKSLMPKKVGEGTVLAPSAELVQSQPIEQTSQGVMETQKIAQSGPVSPARGGLDLSAYQTGDTVEGLKKAQEERDKERGLNRLGQISERMAADIGGFQTRYQDVYGDRIKGADSIVKDFEAKSEQEKNDPMSGYSQAYKKAAEKMLGYPIKGDVSASMLAKIIPGLEKSKEFQIKMEEIRENREARKELALASKKEKQEKAQQLSDKQVEEINAFDKSIESMQDALLQLGNNKDWVGPIDASIPNLLVGDKQVAFRAAVGRMEDAYRHMITGAGASNKELQMLKSRLPNISDTPANFKSKAQDFLKEVSRAKNIHLKNYSKKGKDVSEFVKEEPSASAFPRQVRKGNQVATVKNEQELKEAQEEGFQ